MKSLLLLSVIALLSLGAAAQSTHDARGRNIEIKDRFAGAWKLVSLEEPNADRQLHKADCVGMSVFPRDGRASVQVMYRDAQPMRTADTRLRTAATTSTTLPLSRFTSTGLSCELSSAKI
jgi:hypothetical protein